MTKQVEGVSEKIIACAKEEFLQKGYSDASLRTIAEKAGTTTGSIYSRFKDKEGLFSAIVEPAADHLVQMFLHTQETFHGLEEEQQPKEMKHYVSSGMVEMIDYIYDNFEVFELLLMLPTEQSFRILCNGLSRSRQNILISIWTSFITGQKMAR